MKGPGNARTVLLFVFVGLGLLALLGGIGGGAADMGPRLATRLGGPNGARALVQASQRLGVPATGDVTPPLEWEQPADPDTVRAILGPTRELAAAEVKAVLDWVRSGGDLVLSLADSGHDMDDVALAVASRRLHEEVETLRLESQARKETWGTGVWLLSVGEGRILSLGEPGELSSAALLGLDRPDHPFTEWLRDLVPEEDLLPGLTPDAPDPNRGVALVTHFVRFADGREVLFDDSAHGLGARIDPKRRLAAFLWNDSAGHALVALFALVPLWLVVKGARRGPALPPPAWADAGRSSLEHARALASLWADAGATTRPRELFVADVGQRVGAGRDKKSAAARLLRMAGADADARADALQLGDAFLRDEPIDIRTLTELAKARARFLRRARNS
ncbi:MAG: DUF4350 domain-containing protein [Planctomycetaceae bacterium]|nr:DUF4350 domain-containing protein [Planctomycetaceae bacterium]